RITPPHPGDSSTDIAKYAEPNAIVWAFMNEYAKEHGGKGHEIADSILKWLTSKEMWDGRFIKNGQGERGYSLDAQSRTMVALQAERFVKEFFGGNPQLFADYLSDIEKEFSTKIDIGADHSVTLFDLADQFHAGT